MVLEYVPQEHSIFPVLAGRRKKKMFDVKKTLDNFINYSQELVRQCAP